MKLRAAVLCAACALAGCVSPEATRTRGGGPGGDPGNRPPVVRMHEGSQQYWRTPVIVPGEHVPLDPARHAQRLSEKRLRPKRGAGLSAAAPRRRRRARLRQGYGGQPSRERSAKVRGKRRGAAPPSESGRGWGPASTDP